MKRILLLLLLLFPSLAAAQNSQYLSLVLGPTGKPLAGARITFCSNVNEIAIPCTTTINLFDSTGVPISNPTISDGRGNVNVWAPVGVYLMTVSGPGITPYRVVVNFPGGGGSGVVGPGTPNQMAKFTTINTIGDSTCTDDGVSPTRCPNGLNTATGGNWFEKVVDTGGVVQGKLVCRSSINLIVICPAGATNTVLGVALSTVTVGGTAKVCWTDCNVIVANTVTAGDWLIPSVSIAGAADSVGATKPSTGTQTFLAESTATAGNSVHTPFLSLDSRNAAGGAGTITPCTINGVTYYTALATLFCITPPTANGMYSVIYNVTAGVSVAPTVALAGVATRNVAGTTDTILYSDRANKVNYSSASAVAVTVPQAGSAGFTSNTVFRTKVSGAGIVTFTPTTSTVNGAATFKQSIGQACTWYSDNSNYIVDNCTGPHGLSFPLGDPGGSALSSGATAYLSIPFPCKINGYNLVLAPSGTVTVKFWKIANGTAIPTVANSINTSGVSISSGTAVQSYTLSDFTATQVNTNDIMAMNITAVATAAYVNGVLSCQE